MSPYENKILSVLIDSYERSSLSRGENKVRVRIACSITKKNFPEYFNESSLKYYELHAAAHHLEEMGIVFLKWKNDKKDNILEKVILNENRINDCYTCVSRIPKNDRERNMLMLLEKELEKYDGRVYRSFISDLIKRITEGKSVREFIDISNPDEAVLILKLLAAVESNSSPSFIREFSVRNFNDTKIFEAHKAKLCHIIRNYRDDMEGLENEEILGEYQIYHNPGYVYLKGKASVGFGKERVSLSAFLDGIGIGVRTEQDTDIKILSDKNDIKKVFTIENLTTFFTFSMENALIIYLGGYHNTVRRKLILNIFKELPDAQYYHFGDIDAGGLYIFRHLVQKTGIPMKRYHMDVDTLRSYQAFAKPLTETDRKRLSKLLEMCIEEKDYEGEHLIRYMLEKSIKLEQESIG